MTRDAALSLVHEYTASESLRKHMLAVETCMKWYAEARGTDVELWGLAGLLHDFDYERYPNEHPLWGLEKLKDLGVDESVLGAIESHYPAKTGREPETDIEKYLFATDELSGLITAVTYVRPSKNIADVEVKSVMKKLKEPNFAAGVSREDVHRGCDLIDLPIEDHIENMLTAMKANSIELGLAGAP